MAYAGLPPALKKGVDIQLQTAFAEGNWPTAIRLADRRAKASRDPYYETIKICAESKLEGITEKSSVAIVVDAWVRHSSAPKDIESLELCEWACGNGQFYGTYADTFGALRLRWAKANAKDVPGLISCLQACLTHWDLMNAQQIAAVLDKSSNSSDRRFMFWGILLTHLFSTSCQCPAGKQKMYAMLAQKQIEKAANLAKKHLAKKHLANSADASATVDRSLLNEEEFILYFRILAAHAPPSDFLAEVLHPDIGAIRQLELGRKQAFLEALTLLEASEQWDAIYTLCRHALEMKDSSNLPSTFTCDLRVWRTFVAAAQRHANVDSAFDEIQKILQGFIELRSRLPPMYAKNIDLASLEVAFGQSPALLTFETSNGPSPRVEHILLFIRANVEKAPIFSDIKCFVEKLLFAETRDLLKGIERLSQDNSFVDTAQLLLKVLLCELRYLLATCPCTVQFEAPAIGYAAQATTMSTAKCKVCDQYAESYGCDNCFERIALSALELHEQISGNLDLVSKGKDPRVNLTLVGASSLLKLAGLGDKHDAIGQPWLSRVGVARFLQAALLLDHQFRQTPDDIPLRLLLVRLYSLLGCGSQIKKLWEPLDVKRTILDALGPLYFDRLSSVATGLFNNDKQVYEPLRSYYAAVTRARSAVRIWDAFSSGSYSSILDMEELNDQLRRSCTRAMAVAEERRTARAFGAKVEDLEDVLMLADIDHGVTLVNVTDYGSMANLEASGRKSLAGLLRIGPDLSNARMKLALFAERHWDMVSFKAPKEYKPAKPSQAYLREKAFALEFFSSLESSFMDILHSPNTAAELTPSEEAYFTAMALLSSIVAASLCTTSSAPPQAALGFATSTLKSVLDGLRNAALAAPSVPQESVFVLSTFTGLHSLALFRDASLAVKQTMAYLATYHERENARDRTGKSGLHKDVLAEISVLKTLSTQGVDAIRTHIKSIKDSLGSPGWLDRVGDWAFPTSTDRPDDPQGSVFAVVGGTPGVEDWAGGLLENWRESTRSLGLIKLD